MSKTLEVGKKDKAKFWQAMNVETQDIFAETFSRIYITDKKLKLLESLGYKIKRTAIIPTYKKLKSTIDAPHMWLSYTPGKEWEAYWRNPYTGEKLLESVKAATKKLCLEALIAQSEILLIAQFEPK